MRHTHKQEMELSTPDCTSSYFCHLFTDLCWGRTYLFSIWIYLILFHSTLFYFILFHFILTIFLFIIFYYIFFHFIPFNVLFLNLFLLLYFALSYFILLCIFPIQFNCRVWHSSAHHSIICLLKRVCVYTLKVTDCNADTQANTSLPVVTWQ